jgi:hypothetical protein
VTRLEVLVRLSPECLAVQLVRCQWPVHDEDGMHRRASAGWLRLRPLWLPLPLPPSPSPSSSPATHVAVALATLTLFFTLVTVDRSPPSSPVAISLSSLALFVAALIIRRALSLFVVACRPAHVHRQTLPLPSLVDCCLFSCHAAAANALRCRAVPSLLPPSPSPSSTPSPSFCRRDRSCRLHHRPLPSTLVTVAHPPPLSPSPSSPSLAFVAVSIAVATVTLALFVSV